MSKLNSFSWDDSFGDDFGKHIEESLEGGAGQGEHEFNFGGEQEEEKQEEDKDKGKKKPESEEDKAAKYQFNFGDEEEEEKGEEEEQEEEEQEEEEDEQPDKSKTSKKPESKTGEKLNSKGVLSFLKNKGFIELDDNINIDEMTDDEIEDQLEDVMDASNETYFENQVKDLPPVAKNLLKVAASGGDVGKYLSTVVSGMTSTLKKGLDLSKESNQELVMRNLLAKEGKDAEDIEDEIEFLKSKERLATTAEKKYNKWEADVEKEEETILAQETERKRKAKEGTRKYRNDLTDFLGKTKEVSSFEITVNDKRELPSYIANPAYEAENGRPLSEFQKDLFEALKDNNKVVALAKILKSGFDFSKIVQKGANAALKDTKDKLQNQRQKPSGRAKQPKSLIDMLDGN